MIIYVEKKYINNKITKNILSKYSKKTILEVDNYKNIFDKTQAGNTEKSIIIAGVNNSISEAPLGYGHKGGGYFFKNSLNCIFDCKYCYLKGAFKNDNTVIFVNYDDIKNQILDTISKHRKKNPTETIWFYASDYSDNLALDGLTLFTKEFIPFFETLENVKMEIRTKSLKIHNITNFSNIKNTEIAFSLNPTEVSKKYEPSLPSLDLKIQAIKKLQECHIPVGIRFMPLLEIDGYKKIYSEFLDEMKKEIDFTKIYSVFVGGLLYTKKDYNVMLKKEPYLDLLYKLKDYGDGYYRESREVRNYFYNLFDDIIGEDICNICLDSK